MKRISFFTVMFISIVVLTSILSCSKTTVFNNQDLKLDLRSLQDSIDTFVYVTFLEDYQYDWRTVNTADDLDTILVGLGFYNGKPFMQSDSLFEYNVGSPKDPEILYQYTGGNSISVGPDPGFHNGYIWDGDKCFVHCYYFENPDGSIAPLSCCGDYAGNCTGLDPICCNENEAWVFFDFFIKILFYV